MSMQSSCEKQSSLGLSNRSLANTMESFPFPQVASIAESMFGRNTVDHKLCARAIFVIAGFPRYGRDGGSELGSFLVS